MQVTVVTPDASFYEGPAGFVVLPAWDGEVGIQPGHAPLIARLGHGVARVHATAGAPPVRIAIYGGFLKVQKDNVTVLAGGADLGQGKDLAGARKALDAARQALNESQGKAPADVALAEEGVRRARALVALLAQ